ncbi:MAG: OmpH family outer membrane protein [Saprospiraceae bacterium]|uniref:OmpH family outer membrane protein n=1 Tax=Candidatus Opimibacter skivensis TaxID=2982028 RepID=A0A9D7SVR3_9BACT|nr:OmpH family outer membrane protein [Candidatus Opimibacter skivensis]
MYKITCLLLFLSVTAITQLSAQRIAIVDITRVLEELPDYKSAQTDLDKIAADWRQEIALQYDQIKAMYNKYQAEQVLLTEDAKKAKEDEIMEREKSVRDMQRDKFGPEGALFRKRQDLVQPIQERVYAAIQKYAEDRGFDFIFDKGGTGGLIFSNAEYDKTDDVIRLLSK